MSEASCFYPTDYGQRLECACGKDPLPEQVDWCKNYYERTGSRSAMVLCRECLELFRR